MLDPLFDLLAGMLAWFYSVFPSYGFAIAALTFVVLLIFTPLTYKSTKSMVAMRRLQPQLRRLQKKHGSDREQLNKEMMGLYQEHGVNPLSGCLPMLIQSPVFIVIFRIIRGITRRASTIGFVPGDSIIGYAQANAEYVPGKVPVRNFNPEYLNSSSELYGSLIRDNEMLWLGIDLSRTPLEVVRSSITDAFPYLVMIAVVAVLGWYQQRQIAGRMTGAVSSQQQLIMKVMPWFLPFFSLSMPAGLVLYFIVSALLRVAQQAYITRSVYGDEELTTPIEVDDDDDDDDDGDEPESPFASLFGGGQRTKPTSKHGSRRPTTASNAVSPAPAGHNRKTAKVVKPAEGASKWPSRSKANGDSGSAKKDAKKAAKKDVVTSENSREGTRSSANKATSGPEREIKTGWAKAKRSAKNNGGDKDSKQPERPASRRVTPKPSSGGTKRRRGRN